MTERKLFMLKDDVDDNLPTILLTTEIGAKKYVQNALVKPELAIIEELDTLDKVMNIFYSLLQKSGREEFVIVAAQELAEIQDSLNNLLN